jgi:hypothetical protein
MRGFSAAGLNAIAAKFDKIRAADHTTLMLDWEATMLADNKRGVLAGEDKNGSPLLPVTYRPKGPALSGNRKSDRGYKGFGPSAAGLHGNLSSSEYRRLSGPPLAPRGANSRVITNFFTRHGRNGGQWFVEGAWLDVVSVSGVAFLAFLFALRNLAGIRPPGVAKAQRQTYQHFLKIARES